MLWFDLRLGQCRKMANYDEFEFRRKPLFYAKSSICIPFEPFSCSVFDHSYST